MYAATCPIRRGIDDARSLSPSFLNKTFSSGMKNLFCNTQHWHKFKCQSLHKVHTTNLNEQYYSEVENTLKEHKEENSSNPGSLYGKWIVHKITWDGTECQTLPDGEWCFIIDMYITLNGEYYTYSLVKWGNCAQVALRFSFRTRSVKALTKLCVTKAYK